MVRIGPWTLGVVSEYQAYEELRKHQSRCSQCSRHETMPCDVGYRLHQQWKAAELREKQEQRRGRVA